MTMTQAQTERTAGPWILNGKTGAFRIATSEGQIVLTVSAFSKCGRHGDYYSCETHEATSNTFLSEANARFIVTACNAHDELVAALQALLALNDNHSPFGGEIARDRIERAWDSARAALSQLEGRA